ncbi:Inositol polyphosphate multikinase [Erysiphe neolycopersici]|uniref:Kinase n=1 Tax=Erysiphe neolycopersici TaxID=212602 RepID=A0A420HQV0_9PEZI|nr:Inositol polyphosphate multikinase [Erysiphe neolycopersici]
MAKPFPTCSELVGYNNAVAGHDGVLSDISGELFIKPCTPAEIAFYETSSALHPEFMSIMPTYLGTLALDENIPGAIEKATGSLLSGTITENPFAKSDVSSANKTVTNEKDQSQSKQPTAPCGLNQGIFGNRIKTNNAVVLDNISFGYRRPNILDVKLGVRLWADDAPDAKRIRFEKITAESTHKDLGFRIAGMKVWQGLGAKGEDIEEEGYKIYNKQYGRHLKSEDMINSLRCFIHNERAGVNEDLAKYVAKAFLDDVIQIQTQFENHENRMFAASLLFVYEGDGDALRTAIHNSSHLSPVTDKYEDNDQIKLAKICSVKLIDFAHAEWTPGQGPDENTLVGIRSIVKLLREICTS